MKLEFVQSIMFKIKNIHKSLSSSHIMFPPISILLIILNHKHIITFSISYFIQEWIGLNSLKYFLCSLPPFPYTENSGVQYSYKIYTWFIILKFLQRIIILTIIIIFEVMWCNCKSIESGWVNLTSMQWQISYLVTVPKSC